MFSIQQTLAFSLCNSGYFHRLCYSLLILGLRFTLPDLGARIKQFKLANLARNKLLSKIAILEWDELPSGSAYLYPLIIEAG